MFLTLPIYLRTFYLPQSYLLPTELTLLFIPPQNQLISYTKVQQSGIYINHNYNILYFLLKIKFERAFNRLRTVFVHGILFLVLLMQF
jgi:hypothetical protein